MYRLEGDSLWLPVGYPLPGNKAAITSSIFTIDAGYAVLGHAIHEGFTDSAGVYVYDLNDFSDVKENGQTAEHLMMLRGNMLTFGDDVTDATSVDVWSITGELIAKMDFAAAMPRSVQLHSASSGVY